MAFPTLRADTARDNVIPFPAPLPSKPCPQELEAIEKIEMFWASIRTQIVCLNWWLEEYREITGRAFEREAQS